MCDNNKKTGVFTAKVLKNYPIGERFFRISLEFTGIGAEAFGRAIPGQFLELRVDNLGLPSCLPANLEEKVIRQPILRRPFSFVDIIPTTSGTAVDLLYCVIGTGTARLTTLQENDRISVTGPLGNGFTLPENKKYVIGVAGGIGIPPIQHFLNDAAKKEPDNEYLAFIGARSKADMPVESIGKGCKIKEFACCQTLGMATDDGSLGHQGFVTDCFEKWFAESGATAEQCEIYACGPDPMLATLAKIAHKNGIKCQVSLERMMACGIGLCQSCIVEVQTGKGETENKLCCKDGPVFDSKLVF